MSPCSCHKAYTLTARTYRLRVLLLLLLVLLFRFLKTLLETSDVSLLLMEKSLLSLMIYWAIYANYEYKTQELCVHILLLLLLLLLLSSSAAASLLATGFCLTLNCVYHNHYYTIVVIIIIWVMSWGARARTHTHTHASPYLLFLFVVRV